MESIRQHFINGKEAYFKQHGKYPDLLVLNNIISIKVHMLFPGECIKDELTGKFHIFDMEIWSSPFVEHDTFLMGMLEHFDFKIDLPFLP